MTGSTISNLVTISVTLGSRLYWSPLTIAPTGAINPYLADGAVGIVASISGGYVYNEGGIAGAAGSSHGATGGSGVVITVGSITNKGSITGGAGYASHIAGAGGSGVGVTSGTLINDGTIAGGSGGSARVITYSFDGIGGAGGTGLGVTNGKVTNSGTVAGGNGGDGSHVGGGGGGGTGISLDARSNLLNIGLIMGGDPGFQPGLSGYFYADGAAGADVTNSTLTNDGTILGGGASGNDGGGAAGVNLTNGMLTNEGSIAGGSGGFDGFGGAGVAVDGGTVTNIGTITGGSDTSFYSGIGVVFDDGGTLNDVGFIGGGNGGTAAAVEFGPAASRLILDPGASFSGSVVADAAYNNVLELASASFAGTLAGLGSQYVGFTQITIDAGASWMLNNANTIANSATLTELSGATLIDSGTLVNDGAIVLDPSTMTVSGLTGTGSVTIDADSMLEVQGTIAGNETLGFGGSGAYLHLDSPISVAGTVTNFGFGETLDLKGIDPTSVRYADGMLSFSGGSFALSLASTGPVIASTSGDGAAVFAPCFRADTRILTPSGERPVQELAVGDLVRTVLGEAAAAIVWVGWREVDCARHPQPRKGWPVRVSAGAFGPGRPHTDLWLSPDHAVYVEDVLIPVKHLINGSTIVQVPVARVTYHHIELEQHDVVLAEGLPAESFLDIKDGSNYANRARPVRLYSDNTARMWEAFGCAPLIVTGPELAAARALVASFAAEGDAA